MSLDFEQVTLPLQEMAKGLQAREKEARQRLAQAQQIATALSRTGLETLKQTIEASRRQVRWPVAGLRDDLCQSHPLPSCPSGFTVLAVDGSHMEIDLHHPAQCYLINLGLVRLEYGEQPIAALSSQAMLYWRGTELAIEDPQGHSSGEVIEGTLLSARRSVQECQLLARQAEELPGASPVLALLDGTLVLWGLGGQSYPPFVREALVERGLIPALDRLRAVASRRPLALASYISLPRSADVVNILRISLCPYQVPDCSQYCFTREATQACQAMAGLTDREFFGRFLSPGERSPLFLSPSPLVRNHYGKHQVAFFYLHGGEEIARVEIPTWIANEPSLVELVHATAFDQCQRGMGYPVALSEAHQQAVVTAADRDSVWRLVERALAAEDLVITDSAKNRSKQTRCL